MMRKKIRQINEGKQLVLFDERVVSFRPIKEATNGISELIGSESLFFSQLLRNRALTVSLLDKVMESTNLNRAYGRIRLNDGISGIDGMTTEELGLWLQKHIEELQSEVLRESYKVSGVLGLEIPKKSGGTRLLGIPTVKDRLIQQSIHQELQKLYDPLFSDHSYGFRPRRNAHQAISQSSEYISEGYTWVVDIDLENFFDKINHDRLMQRLSKGIGDKRLLRLIHQYLRAGLLQDGLTQQRISGTPQGGPLSPLLSNIYLDELDKELEKRDHRFVRYADDCNIYVKSQRSGERVLESLTQFIEVKLQLKVNRVKSGVRRCDKVNFLGHTILRDGRIRISDRSIDRFKDKVRKITKRNRGVRFSSILEELNRSLRGWVSYFRYAESWLPWRDLDRWIRHRLRSYRLKQCGRKYTLFKFLRSLGAEVRGAWKAIRLGGSWWRLSRRFVCQMAMNNEWFKRQGYVSLASWYQKFNC